MSSSPTSPAATRNACKLCAPLGACLAFKGVQGCVPLLHGSQGCATYIRRYMISHYREPVDVASSSFGEDAAVFGGERNLRAAIANVERQYRAEVIGIATTCLSETMGEDVRGMLAKLRRERGPDGPALVHVATPSYAGSHIAGFRAALQALAEQLGDRETPRHDGINLFAGMVSPADLRGLRETCRAYGLWETLLPDYSDTLDGPAWSDYAVLPEGGTPVDAIRRMPGARASITLGGVSQPSAGAWLAEKHGVSAHHLELPVGLRLTDALHERLAALSGKAMPVETAGARGRLVDAYVDAHKYVAGTRAVVFGDSDLVVALASFLGEIGIRPVVVMSGDAGSDLAARLAAVSDDTADAALLEGGDFQTLLETVRRTGADLLIGNSKGYSLSRELELPLVRVGFPIHDRFGGARIRHLDYAGTQDLFDRIVNTLLERRQDTDDWGYTYL